MITVGPVRTNVKAAYNQYKAIDHQVGPCAASINLNIGYFSFHKSPSYTWVKGLWGSLGENTPTSYFINRLCLILILGP